MPEPSVKHYGRNLKGMYLMIIYYETIIFHEGKPYTVEFLSKYFWKNIFFLLRKHLFDKISNLFLDFKLSQVIDRKWYIQFLVYQSGNTIIIYR